MTGADLNLLRQLATSALASDASNDMTSDTVAVRYAFPVRDRRPQIPNLRYEGVLTALDDIRRGSLPLSKPQMPFDTAVWGERQSRMCQSHSAAAVIGTPDPRCRPYPGQAPPKEDHFRVSVTVGMTARQAYQRVGAHKPPPRPPSCS